MINNCIIMGRLVADPELHTTNSGISVTSFTIACERDYQPDKDNKVSDFINVTAWRGTAEFICNYFAKGRMILINGELQQRRYVDKEGNNRTTYEVQANKVFFCDNKRNEDVATTVATDTAEEIDANLPF